MVISSFLILKFYSAFKEKYLSLNPNEEEISIIQKGQTLANIFVNAIPFAILTSGIGAIILAFLIPSHPIFLPVSIIMLTIFIVLSTIFSNFLWEFLNASPLVSIANQYPLVVNIVRYLPYIIGIIGTILIIVMYSKSGVYE